MPLPKLPEFPKPPKISEIIKKANPIKGIVEDAREVIKSGREEISEVASSLRVEGQEEPSPGEKTRITAQELENPPENEPQSRTASPGVTTKETIAYQKRELGKELLLLEKHLSEGCRIPPTTGEPCDCCLVPETEIYTDESITQIRDTREYNVLAHTGRVRKVKRHFSHPSNVVLREVYFSYSNIPLRITPNHSFFAIEGGGVTHSNWRQKRFDEGRITQIPAGSLSQGDLVAFPRIRDIIDIRGVSVQLAELLGWYVAEGCHSRESNRITLSLNHQESHHIARIIELFEKCFSETPKLTPRETSIQISFCNKEFSPIFKGFGQVAVEKHLPGWFLLLPEQKQYSFLKGYLHGDGHLTGPNERYSMGAVTVSRNLAYQLRLLLFRLGLLHSLSRRPITSSNIKGRVISSTNSRFDIRLYGESMDILATNLGIPLRERKRAPRNRGWVGKEWVFLPVRKNKPFPYQGSVCNLSVETDESYLTVNGVLHNCSPKHTITIEALALETYGITGDPTYQELAKWAEEIERKTTIPEIESGRHNYGGDAVQARGYRKKLLGSESLGALLSPSERGQIAERATKIVEEEKL